MKVDANIRARHNLIQEEVCEPGGEACRVAAPVSVPVDLAKLFGADVNPRRLHLVETTAGARPHDPRQRAVFNVRRPSSEVAPEATSCASPTDWTMSSAPLT